MESELFDRFLYNSRVEIQVWNTHYHSTKTKLCIDQTKSPALNLHNSERQLYLFLACDQINICFPTLPPYIAFV